MLQQLLTWDQCEEIVLLNRKNLALSHPKIIQFEIDFDNQSTYLAKIKGDLVFCCIGTTRKKTPNTEAYRNIDVGIPQKAVFAAQKNKVKQLHLISAIGANKNAKVTYNKIKGESEEVCLKSSIPSIHIYRPGLLIGKRNETRIGESIFQKIAPLFDLFCRGKYSKYHSISASKLAEFILKTAINNEEGKLIHSYPFSTF